MAAVRQDPLHPARCARTGAKGRREGAAGSRTGRGSTMKRTPGTTAPRGPLTAGLLLFRSKLVPNPLQGHFSHEEGDGKIALVPVSTEEQDKHVGAMAGIWGPAPVSGASARPEAPRPLLHLSCSLLPFRLRKATPSIQAFLPPTWIPQAGNEAQCTPTPPFSQSWRPLQSSAGFGRKTPKEPSAAWGPAALSEKRLLSDGDRTGRLWGSPGGPCWPWHLICMRSTRQKYSTVRSYFTASANTVKLRVLFF